MEFCQPGQGWDVERDGEGKKRNCVIDGFELTNGLYWSLYGYLVVSPVSLHWSKSYQLYQFCDNFCTDQSV